MRRERLRDLLVDRCTQGLDPSEEIELEAALSAEWREEADSIERAAAVLHVAFLDRHEPEPLPAALRRRLVHRAPGRS